MKPQQLLSILHTARNLKDTTRHCYTRAGRRESVAEHSWMMALMAYLLQDEFPGADMNKVIAMCLIHDLGEAFTGDIPTFLKTDEDAEKEDNVLLRWVETLPEFQRAQFKELLTEMLALKTPEAKLYKSLDKMEAVIQHNEADISSWLPLEYDLQLTYGAEEVKCAPYMTELKAQIDEWTKEKIEAAGGKPEEK